LVRSGEGLVLSLLGLETVVKVGCGDSGGSMFLAHQVVLPGMGVPPHVHTREDEVFFILEGEVEFLVGDEVLIARAGDVVQAPRGRPHGYRGAGEVPAKMWFLVTPGQIEGMFLEMAGWPAGEEPDPSRLADLCGRYGITFV